MKKKNNDFLIFRLTFLYLGMCTMLPWNFLISISAFWNYKFRNVTTDMFINGTNVDPPDPAPMPVPVIKPTDMQVAFPSYVAIGDHLIN